MEIRPLDDASSNYKRVEVDLTPDDDIPEGMGFVCGPEKKKVMMTIIPEHTITGRPIGKVPDIKVEVYEGAGFNKRVNR